MFVRGPPSQSTTAPILHAFERRFCAKSRFVPYFPVRSLFQRTSPSLDFQRELTQVDAMPAHRQTKLTYLFQPLNSLRLQSFCTSFALEFDSVDRQPDALGVDVSVPQDRTEILPRPRFHDLLGARTIVVEPSGKRMSGHVRRKGNHARQTERF